MNANYAILNCFSRAVEWCKDHKNPLSITHVTKNAPPFLLVLFITTLSSVKVSDDKREKAKGKKIVRVQWLLDCYEKGIFQV